MDDPLSALDAGTAKQVFNKLIKSPNALFNNTAVLLVTHASHFLNRVDSILVVVDGAEKFLGTWNDLAYFEADDLKTQGAVDFIRNSVQEDNDFQGDDDESPPSKSYSENGVGTSTLRALMTVEEREHGLSSISTWLLWFSHAGGTIYLGVLTLLMTGDRFAYVATEYWLARWTSAANGPITVFGITFPSQTDGREAQYEYLMVYSIILLVSTIFTLLRYVAWPWLIRLRSNYFLTRPPLHSSSSEWSGKHSSLFIAAFASSLQALTGPVVLSH